MTYTQSMALIFVSFIVGVVLSHTPPLIKWPLLAAWLVFTWWAAYRYNRNRKR